MNWCFYCLKLLRLNLNFKNNIFNKNFFFFWQIILNESVRKLTTLIRIFIKISSKLPNIFLKMKMNSILYDFKPLNEIILQNVIFIHVNHILISNFSLYPMRFITLFTIIINKFTPKHNTSFYNLIWFNTKFSEPRKLSCHTSNNLDLLTLYWIRRVFNLNVRL